MKLSENKELIKKTNEYDVCEFLSLLNNHENGYFIWYNLELDEIVFLGQDSYLRLQCEEIVKITEIVFNDIIYNSYFYKIETIQKTYECWNTNTIKL